MFRKGGIDELKTSKGCFVFFATISHEQMWRGTLSLGGRLGSSSFPGHGHRHLAVHPSLPQGPGSLSGLSGYLASASLAPWHTPLCSF